MITTSKEFWNALSTHPIIITVTDEKRIIYSRILTIGGYMESNGTLPWKIRLPARNGRNPFTFDFRHGIERENAYPDHAANEDGKIVMSTAIPSLMMMVN
ncbi:hypothetical protein GTW56_27865 [Bacillus sp. EB93]|nr:hypothetical protein [Peribacillus frigoritolerans]